MKPHRTLRVLALGLAAGASVVAVFTAGGHSAGPLRGCAGTWQGAEQDFVEPDAGKTTEYTFETTIPNECDMSNSAYWSLQLVSSKPGTSSCDHLSVFGFPGYDKHSTGGYACAGVVLKKGSRFWEVHVTIEGHWDPSQGRPRDEAEVFARMYWYAGGVEQLGVCLNRHRVHFGRVEVGDTSTSEAVTVSNCGSAEELDVTGVSLAGAASKSFKLANHCAGAKLTSSATCTFSIAFKPDATGLANTKVTLNSNAPPETVSLDGKGVCPTSQKVPHVPCPFVVITPSNLDGSDVKPRDTGALDFGSVQAGKESESMVLTVENGGDAPLHIDRIGEPSGGGFRKDAKDTTCIGAAVKPGATCKIGVTFTPQHGGGYQRSGELELSDDAADSPQFVSLRGTATNERLQPTAVGKEQGVYHNPSLCQGHGVRIKDLPLALKAAAAFLSGSPLAATLALAVARNAQVADVGWAPLTPGQATRLVGQVVEGHVARTDMVGINDREFHENSDLDVFVYPDEGYRGLLVTPGEFRAEGDDFTPSEAGRMTVESETSNPLDPGRPGLPEWVWPTMGDKLDAIGVQIFDCGHGGPTFRSEIHPVEFIATYRNAALTPGATTSGLGSSDPETGASATRVDVFASSYSGPVYGVETGNRGLEWQPTHGPYTFDVVAPPKPTPTAELAEPNVLKREGSGGGGELSWTKLPNDRGYHFTLKLSSEKHSSTGDTIWVEWRDPHHPDQVKARTHSYVVRLISLTALNALTHKWGLYASINEVQTQSLLFGGRNLLRQTWHEVSTGETISLASVPSLRVVLVDGQALHVEFRVTSWEDGLPFDWFPDCCGDYGHSDFAGTTGHVYDASEVVTVSGGTRTQYGGADLPNNSIGADELSGKCAPNACYEIKYSVTRLS